MSVYLSPGEEIEFTPEKGNIRKGFVEQYLGDWTYRVLLDGDPFAITAKQDQLRACRTIPESVESEEKVSDETQNRKGKSMTPAATDAKPKLDGKALRKQAQALGIEGWEDMGKEQMLKAIKKAKKAQKSADEAPKAKSTKKSTKKVSKNGKTAKALTEDEKPVKKTKAKPPAKKANKKAIAKVTKTLKKMPEADALGIELPKKKALKPLPAEGENPFRPSSNLHKIAKLLLKGGTRRSLAEALAKSVDLNPYVKERKQVDLLDYDKRLLLGAQTMRDIYGYGVQRVGRSIEGKILVFRPGGPKDPRGGKTKAKK